MKKILYFCRLSTYKGLNFHKYGSIMKQFLSNHATVSQSKSNFLSKSAIFLVFFLSVFAFVFFFRPIEV